MAANVIINKMSFSVHIKLFWFADNFVMKTV